MPVFNKSRLYNVGIERTTTDVLTFLDADMLVGERFMGGVDILHERPEIHKLCYRVRRLPRKVSARWLDATPKAWPALAHQTFADWKHFQLEWEAYCHPLEDNPKNHAYHPTKAHGNSQFSVRREVMGDLRYDERYEGHGREDLDFNIRFANRFGDDYRGHLRTEPEYGLLHLWHPKDMPGWDGPEFLHSHQQLMKEHDPTP